jgi:hypothetical protein
MAEIIDKNFKDVTDIRAIKATSPELSGETLKPIAQPGDTVLFQGKKTQVISVDPNDEDGMFTVLLDGMTIQCGPRQIEVLNKVDTVEAPMKFDKNTLKLIDESIVTCTIDNTVNLSESSYAVKFGEWKRKKGNQKVRVGVISESGELINMLALPKADISIQEIPDEGFIDGAIIGENGEATRKVKINAAEYATSENADDMISVLYITPDGYKDGEIEKDKLSTLAV